MRSALVLAGIAVLGLLTACSTPSSTPPAAGGSSSTTSSAAPVAAVADGSAAHPLAFGQTWAPPGKLSVTVGAPAAYKPSSSAFVPGGAAARAVAMDVTVINTDKAQPVPAMTLSLQATAGSTQAQEIQDSGQNVGTPTATILPGKTLTWKVAFAVPVAGGEFTVGVGTVFGGETIYFTGKI